MPTYENFVETYTVPYAVVTFFYIFSFYIMTFKTLWILPLKCICKRISFAEGCAKRCEACLTWFSTWVVRLIFGKSEGIAEGEESEGTNYNIQSNRESLSQDEDGFKRIYINKHKMDTTDVHILAIIILCFSFLVAITAYSVYLLKVTHHCSEDSAIYCFPQLIDVNDPGNPNITEGELMYPITDCNEWVNSTKITFQCFRYVFDAKAALTVAGGLLTFFTIATRVTIGILLKLFKWIVKKCDVCLEILQVSAAITLLAFTTIIAAVVLSYQLDDHLGNLEAIKDPVARRTAAYIADNGTQLLIVLGTIALLLFIDWRKYVREQNPGQRQGNKGQHSSSTAEDAV